MTPGVRRNTWKADGAALGLIGDVVNVAARVEQLTKTSGDTILITDATRRLLTRPVAADDRGPADVRGLADSVSVHAVPGAGGVGRVAG